MKDSIGILLLELVERLVRVVARRLDFDGTHLALAREQEIYLVIARPSVFFVLLPEFFLEGVVRGLRVGPFVGKHEMFWAEFVGNPHFCGG